MPKIIYRHPMAPMALEQLVSVRSIRPNRVIVCKKRQEKRAEHRAEQEIAPLGELVLVLVLVLMLVLVLRATSTPGWYYVLC